MEFKNFLAAKYDYFWISLFSFIFFTIGLGNLHLFDWDEINFAEAAREMLITKNYLQVSINFEPFWEKPPLFIWLQAFSMKIFGVNEFAARFPNAIAGVVSLNFLYYLGKKIKDRQFGLIWVFIYTTSTLPFLYFKSGIIDPWFNLFIFIGVVLFYYSIKNATWKQAVSSGFFIGLAILTKGPVGLLLPGLTMAIMAFVHFKNFKRYFIHGILVILVSVATAGLWFGAEYLQNGPWFITEFFTYQIRLMQTEDAGHGGFMGYHFIVILLGVFPTSIFAIKQLNLNKKTDFQLWMLVLFVVVLTIFSLVQSKIVHYSSLAYFPITFLGGLTLYDWITHKISISKLTKWGILLIGGIWAMAVILLPILGKNIPFLQDLLANDPFTSSNLNAKVTWTGLEVIPALFLLTGIYIFLKSSYSPVQKVLFLFIGNLLFVFGVLFFDINKIEAISQRAAIEFFKEKSSENVEIIPSHYKSYAHLFYGKKNPNPRKDKQYFVTKIGSEQKVLKYHPNLKLLYKKNGFVFYEKKDL